MSSAAVPVRSVVVVGGTHGNEYTGVWCIKALQRQLDDEAKTGKTPTRPFALSTLLGNPSAHQLNRRFVEEDLNRQFSYEALVNSPSDSLESKRAQELNELLGPKFGSEPPKTDVIIDLHSTTANMGITLIVGAGDPLTTQAAAFVQQRCRDADPVSILMHTHEHQRDRPHVASISPHAFSIEVGPVPQGVLRHDKVAQTQRALQALLEFLERRTTDPKGLQEELHQAYPSGLVPCIISAPAKRFGEMSSKIAWPSDPENPNFPAWMVHESVQDRDFAEIHTGDPLFVDLDGNVINYDGSHGPSVILMFVNEGGYYYASSGTGVSVARRDEYELETGILRIPLDEDSANEL